MGFFCIENQQSKSVQEVISSGFEQTFKMFEYLSYELADLKIILFDISSSVRGLGGVKKSFDPKELPSAARDRKTKAELEQKAIENETPEQKLERHKAFFEELRNSFKK